MPGKKYAAGNLFINGNKADSFDSIIGEEFEFLRNDTVTELLSVKPPFLVRWGITIFLLVLCGAVAACWFIHYPDVVPARGKLSGTNTPKEVKTKTDGQLEALLVQEGQLVEKGAVLGYLESRAEALEVLSLSKMLDSTQLMVSGNSVTDAVPLFQKPLLHLGEVQQDYQVFLSAVNVFKQYLATGFYPKKKRLIQEDFDYLQKVYDNLYSQLEKQREDLELQKEDFSANEYLKNEKVISAAEYRLQRSKLIGKELAVPQLEEAILNIENSRNQKRKESMELDNQIAQQRDLFVQAFNTFKVKVDEWKAKYILVAPVSGWVTFSNFIQPNQQLQANQLICFINPGGSRYYAEVYMLQADFGKVRLQQRVLFKLPSYPYREYGKLEGRLEFISHIPTDSGYLAKVSLPSDLRTNYNRVVQFRNGLTADAEIVTKDLRLLERFYLNLKSAVVN